MGDHHVDPGDHFADQPDFVDSWPAHCVAHTAGAEHHPRLAGAAFAAVFDKGAYAAAYSGFEGTSADGASLADWLRSRGVHRVDVCGIATDYCVNYSAVDGARLGFEVTVREDLTRAIDLNGSLAAARAAWAEAGVTAA